MTAMTTMIVLIDQVSNLDEHLYLLLGISRLQKLTFEVNNDSLNRPGFESG